jgi:hypothetical protein
MADKLATALGSDLGKLETRRFPDEEACCGEEEVLEAGIEDATVAQFPFNMASSGSRRSSRRSAANRSSR